MSVNWKEAQQKAARTARWAVTMTKVHIRQVYGDFGVLTDFLAGAPAVGEGGGSTSTLMRTNTALSSPPVSVSRVKGVVFVVVTLTNELAGLIV